MKKLFTLGLLTTGIIGLTACKKEAEVIETPTIPEVETPETPTTPEVVIPGKVLTPEEAAAKREASEANYLLEKEENLRLSILDMLAQAEARTAIKKEVFFATQAYNKEQAERAAAKEALKAEMEAAQEAKAKDETLAIEPDLTVVKEAVALKIAIDKEIYFTEAYNASVAAKAAAKEGLKAEMEIAAIENAVLKTAEKGAVEVALSTVETVKESVATLVAIDKEIFFTEAYNAEVAAKAAAKEGLKAEMEIAAIEKAILTTIEKGPVEVAPSTVAFVKEAVAKETEKLAKIETLKAEITTKEVRLAQVNFDLSRGQGNKYQLRKEKEALEAALRTLKAELAELLA